MIVHASFLENKGALCLPSYGAEARGGTASCSIIFSNTRVKSPILEQPEYLIFFNNDSFKRFHQHVRPGVTLLYNTSQMGHLEVPFGVTSIGVPLEKLVESLDKRCANMAMLGVFLELTKILDFNSMEASVRQVAKAKGSSFISMNLEAIEIGRRWAQQRQLSLSSGS